jgi:hypothetical protein
VESVSGAHAPKERYADAFLAIRVASAVAAPPGFAHAQGCCTGQAPRRCALRRRYDKNQTTGRTKGQKFGTTPEELKAAVKKVGVMADNVEAELWRH